MTGLSAVYTGKSLKFILQFCRINISELFFELIT